jgi:hypothetical protein
MSQLKRQAPEWPKAAKVGSTIVKAYRQTRANGTPGCYLADYSSGVRRMRSFPTAAAALFEANRLARLLSSGEAFAARADSKDVAEMGWRWRSSDRPESA